MRKLHELRIIRHIVTLFPHGGLQTAQEEREYRISGGKDNSNSHVGSGKSVLD